MPGQPATAVRAEGDTGASGESALSHLAVRGGFTDAEQLRSGRDASSGHLESFFECRFFKVVEV